MFMKRLITANKCLIVRNCVTVRPYFPSPSAPRRTQNALFCGRMSSDSFEVPQVIHTPVKEALKDADDEKFVRASFALIRHFETLDENHPLWLNSDFMFNGEFSNFHSSYRSIFKMCLLKSVSTTSPKLSPSSNYSGHYFVGPRGIGKSVMMQTCCLIVGQLLPNIASIYIDASVLHGSPLRHSLVHLMNERSQGQYPDLSLDSSIVSILSRSAELQCVIALFIDEAHVLYKNDTDWPDILACITGFRCAVFLSGSDNLLVPCVKLQSRDREFLDREFGKFEHESLNTTKLTQKSVNGFATKEQYLRFFKSRPNMLAKLCPALNGIQPLTLESDLVQDEIESLHSLTAGRMRAMHALRQGSVEYSELMDFDPLSVTEDDLQHLQPFFDIVKQRGSFDPFDLPRLSVGSQLSQETVFKLLQRKLISYVRAGVVTLASPAVYLACQKRPCVFISHAESDKEKILEMVEMLKDISTVVCSSDYYTRAHLSKEKSQKSWESNQILNIGQDRRYGIVVLSSAYCEKVDSGYDVGAAREWESISTLPDSAQNSVIYAYIGKHAENVKGAVKTHLGDKPLLRFASSDAKSFFHRLMDL